MRTIIKRTTTPQPIRHNTPAPYRDRLALKPGRVWKSWEQLRVGGQAELAALQPGEVGQLRTRDGSFRVLREADYQTVYGLACDVDRLQTGVGVIITAALSVREHRDEATVNTLVEIATYVTHGLPALPTRDRFAPLAPETHDAIDPDDEVELDPVVLHRAASAVSPSRERSAK